MPSVMDMTIQTRLGCARTRRTSVSTIILGSFGVAVTTVKAALNVKHGGRTVAELNGTRLFERRVLYDRNPFELFHELIDSIFGEAWTLQAHPPFPVHLHRLQPDSLGETTADLRQEIVPHRALDLGVDSSQIL